MEKKLNIICDAELSGKKIIARSRALSVELGMNMEITEYRGKNIIKYAWSIRSEMITHEEKILARF